MAHFFKMLDYLKILDFIKTCQFTKCSHVKVLTFFFNLEVE